MTSQNISPVIRLPLAGILAWLVPGLGHIFLGDRARGLTCLVTVTVTFWSGVAIGGVRSTVDPQQRKLWFMAQLCTGGNTLGAYALHQSLKAGNAKADAAKSIGHWSSADVGVHYTGVAGLLNLLVIFDAIARADAVPTRRSRRKRTEPAT